MNSYSFLLILLCFEFILNSGSGDLTIDEVKRNINLKGSIITIENRIKFKKNSLEDTFRYAVTKNNTKSLIRITAETVDNKKLEIQKISEEQDYDFYEILVQDSDEIIVKEDYFEKLLFKPKNIYIKEDQLEVFIDTVNLVSPYAVKKTTTTVILPSENNLCFNRKTTPP